ncbi:MAG TPA: M56 family metallopeptidase [Longimicrobium sp.]|nr:M56 family metallopeptidase [Longimicrobium sp.]
MALPAAPLAPDLAQAALIVAKSTLLLAAAAAGAHAMRRGSAAARHLVWALALGALVALPSLALVLPRWKPTALAVLRPAGGGAEWAVPAASAAPQWSIAGVLVAVWAAGAVVVLARLARGLWAVRRLAHTARRVDDPAWTGLLEELGRAMEVRRPVVLLRSERAAMPLTWGALRPAILLPAGADAWSPERRRVVLLHELAHVARRDCLVQTLAEACCALWWFHPGAWAAARRMRIEREQACDDRVLAAGARASDYAGHLLEVARTCHSPALSAAIAMARPSHLEGRVRAVLAAERDRRGVHPRIAAVCAGAVLLASLPLAAVAPSERAEVPGVVAWEMPPARATRQPGIHGHVTVTKPARVAAPARSAPAARPRHAAAPAVAERAPEPARAQQRREGRELSISTPTLAARLDAEGTLHARVRLPRGLDLRVEGHGVRTVGGELRVSLDARRAISLLEGSGEAGDKCPERGRTPTAGPAKKLAGDVRRVVADHKHDLALSILADLSAPAEAPSRRGKTPVRDDEAAGGV